MAEGIKQGKTVEAEEMKATDTSRPIGKFNSIGTFTKNGLAEIVDATKSVNAFPIGASRDLYCAYPSFRKIIDLQSDRILGLISKVLKWQNIKGNIQRRQPDEQFEMLLECNDAMLERLGSNLDELAGIRKNPQTIVVESCLSAAMVPCAEGRSSKMGAGSWNTKINDPSSMAVRLITAKNIARPQIKFQIPVDNGSGAPFIPKLKDKPNSLKPLALLPEYDHAGNVVSYLHPYEFELMKFTVPESQLKRKLPQTPLDIAVTELMHVDTMLKLNAALEELRGHTEIAIDVEHHSYRTFQGITCLVQISTRSKDYLFDALALREEMHVLNEIFTNPQVVKILHGADLDIEWLQRDLSLYIVNMFDTHQAAKMLNFPRLSLSYLLKYYCEIDADKTFQLADWRIRPLPLELINYARQDTHFLIYIYECITNDILDMSNNQENLLATVYQRSTEICKKRYIKPTVGLESHLDLFRKSKRVFDNRQLFALREIFKWRDSIARVEDESYGYVLPNHMMLQISESLPREMQGILACCNPIPPLVRQNLHTLHQIVLRAREQPLVKPILETEVTHRVAISSAKDYNSKLYCPHDLSHCSEFRDDLPTLFKLNESGNVEQQRLEESIEYSYNMCKPGITLFDTADNSEAEQLKKNLKKLDQIQFISPYERYLAMLPIIEKEKREEAARIEAENKKRQLCPAAPALETLNCKQEPLDEKANQDDVDSLYSLPIKELLKRKYEESVAKKADEANNSNLSQTKRKKLDMMTTTPADDKLNLACLPSIKKSNNDSDKVDKIEKTDISHVEGSQIIDDSVVSEEMPSTSSAHQQKQRKFKKSKQHIKSKRNILKSHKNPGQSSDKPVQTNFDYKKVDFKKFLGGAQRATGTELKPQFHGKGKSNKANNKKFNKLFTFSNVKGKK